MDNKYLGVLKQYWGYDSFRGIQEEIITSVGEGHDTLGLMPTGGGKSICFQVPALTMDGICLVVTPLIALMKDQVLQLKMRGIRAEAVYSGMSRDDIVRVLDNAVLGGVKFLYVSPERLASDLFIAKIQRMQKIALLVVDEAHCVSQWGYDFRPAYLKIADIKKYTIGNFPILALTATATPDVVDDIQEQLGFKEKHVFRMSFERKNLIYVVRNTRNKLEEMLHILKSIPQGSAIVYVRSRRATAELAKYLISEGITAVNYHAGLTDAEKDFRQSNWVKNRTRVMVATNAFGMGIDKPDVRLVIHFHSPDSLEAYFQEAGRAGRDGLTSYAILLRENGDSKVLHQRVPQTYPDLDYIIRTYEDVCCFLQVGVGESECKMYDFDRPKFCRYFKHFEAFADSALKLLTNAGYIEYCEEQDFKSALRIIIRKEELYHLWGQSHEADVLMNAILRNYPGVFATFIYVEETHLSHVTGLTVEQIYGMLKEWNRSRIIDYIPRRNTPTITFTMARVETERLVLPPMIYEDRKADLENRIAKVIEYASSDYKCRSRLLLDYFGEKEACDCGKCDVCLSHKGELKETKTDDVVRAIVQLLNDGKWHDIEDVKALPYEQGMIDNALSRLMDEEKILADGIEIRLNV